MAIRIIPRDRSKSKYPFYRVRIVWRRLRMAVEASPLLQAIVTAVAIAVPAYGLLWLVLAAF